MQQQAKNPYARGAAPWAIAPLPAAPVTQSTGSRILQWFAIVLVIIHMARPFDVVLTGFHIPMIVCGSAVIAAFACGGFGAMNSTTGRLLTAFLVWTLLVSPFSVWRGGSATYAAQYFALEFVLVLVIGAGPSSLKQLKTQMSVLAVSATMSMVWFSRGGTGGIGEERLGGLGEWGNAGDFALTAGFLLPFCIFTSMRMKIPAFRYLFVVGWGLFMFRTTIATATRSAILAFMFVLLVLLIRVSMAQRVFVVIAAVLASVAVLVSVPADVLGRLGTLTEAIGLSKDSGVESEARGSAEERKELQFDALRMIAENPVLGVGPGQFPNYRYTNYIDPATGLHKRWFPAHNTYLQIGAECGIMGGLLYIGFIGSIFFTLAKVRRMNRPDSHPEWQTVRRMGLCIELSLAFFVVGAAFLNCQTYAHQFILAGMVIALERLTAFEVARHASGSPPVGQGVFGHGVFGHGVGASKFAPAFGPRVPVAVRTAAGPRFALDDGTRRAT